MTIEIFWSMHWNQERSLTSQQPSALRFCSISFDTLSTTIWHKPVDPILWQICQHKLASVGLCHSGAIIVIMHFCFFRRLHVPDVELFWKCVMQWTRLKGNHTAYEDTAVSFMFFKIHTDFGLTFARAKLPVGLVETKQISWQLHTLFDSNYVVLLKMCASGLR